MLFRSKCFVAFMCQGLTSGGVLTTLLNSITNESLTNLANILASNQAMSFFLQKILLGDDGGSEMTERGRNLLQKVTDLLGMTCKINEIIDLPEYNSAFAYVGTDGGSGMAKKFGKGVKSLITRYDGRDLQEEHQTSIGELFLLQAQNYAEWFSNGTTPGLRAVIRRSINLFGMVKMDQSEYARLHRDNKPHRARLGQQCVEMCERDQRIYVSMQFGCTLEELVKEEKEYVKTGVFGPIMARAFAEQLSPLDKRGKTNYALTSEEKKMVAEHLL